MSTSSSPIPSGSSDSLKVRIEQPGELKISPAEVKRASISVEESTSKEEKDVEFYITSPSGDCFPVDNITPELSKAIAESRAEVEKYITDYNAKNKTDYTFKNLDFKHLTCEVYDGKNKGEVTSINVDFTDKIKEVRRLSDSLISTEGWPKMPKDQQFDFGSGTRVIGSLSVTKRNVIKEKMGKIFDRFKESKSTLKGSETEILRRLEYKREKLTDEDEIIFNVGKNLKSRLAKTDTICELVIEKLKSKDDGVEAKKGKLKNLKRKINNKDTLPAMRDDLNVNANTLKSEIQELETKTKAYENLQDNQFALQWALTFRSSSLAQRPIDNARQSYVMLEEFIQKEAAGLLSSPKKVEDYCTQVSAMLIPKRGERVRFLQEHNADLEELSLDERFVNALQGQKTNPQIVEELLKTPEKPPASSSSENIRTKEETEKAKKLQVKVERSTSEQSERIELKREDKNPPPKGTYPGEETPKTPSK